MTKSLAKRIGIASAIMMVSVFLSRIMGLVRESVIAYMVGMGREVDAYQVAFVLPEILNHIAASGFLSITFIPIFTDYLAEGREEEGWRAVSIILTVMGCLLAVFIAVSMIFAPWLVALLAPGWEDPAVKAHAVHMTRIVLPAQFFFFAGGMFMAVQFARERFFIPALQPLVYNGGIIAGGLILGPVLGIEGFSWGALGGAILGSFLLQYFGAAKVGMRLKLEWVVRHPALKDYFLRSLPLMVGLTMMFSTEIFFKLFGSYLPEGGIASLNYGLRIVLAVVGFFGYAVGMASYPFLARLASENRIGEMTQLLDNTLRYLSLLVPLSALFIVVRAEVVSVLYQHGAFSAANASVTSGVLAMLMVGAFAFAAQTMVVRGWYARKNTLFPSIYGSISVVVSIPLYVAGLHWAGTMGVAAAVSFSAVLQVTLLYALWNREIGNKDSGRVIGAFVRQIILAVPLGLAAAGFRHLAAPLLNPEASTIGSLAVCIATGLFFLLLLAVAGWLFKNGEILEFLSLMKKRWRRKAA